MTRVRKATGAAVPTAALFRAPTIADLAAVLAGMPRGEAGAVPRAPFTAAQKAAGVPCSSSMQGMGRTALEAPEQVACANIPVTLRLAGALDLGALRAALALLVARHEPLRTRFVVRSGEVLQAVAPADDPRAAPQLAVEPAPAGGAAALMARLEAEAGRPFDLFEDRSLMRCLLLTAGEDESTLMVCVHHAGAPARGRCACPARCPTLRQGRAQGPRLVPVTSAREMRALPCVLAQERQERPGQRASRIRIKAPRKHMLRRANSRLGTAVFDGWSEGVVLAELPAAYAALAAGGAPDLPPLAASYVDYSFWQRGRLEDERGALAPQLAYWRGQLAGVPAAAPLRGDFRGPPGPGSMGGSLPLSLPADLARSLRSLAAACGATLFVVVLAAWKARARGSCMRPTHRRLLRRLCGVSGARCLTCRLRVCQPQQRPRLTAAAARVLRRLFCGMQVLLGQHSGSDDIITCTPMAGRTAPELEPLVGAQAHGGPPGLAVALFLPGQGQTAVQAHWPAAGRLAAPHVHIITWQRLQFMRMFQVTVRH